MGRPLAGSRQTLRDDPEATNSVQTEVKELEGRSVGLPAPRGFPGRPCRMQVGTGAKAPGTALPRRCTWLSSLLPGLPPGPPPRRQGLDLHHPRGCP